MDPKKIFMIAGIGIICIAMVISAFFFRQKYLETERIAFLNSEIERVNMEMLSIVKKAKDITAENEGLSSEEAVHEERLSGLKADISKTESSRQQLQMQLVEKQQQLQELKGMLNAAVQQQNELQTGLQQSQSEYNDIKGRVDTVRSEKMQLEDRIRNRSQSSEGVELKKIVVKMKPPVEGMILEVNPRYNFAVVNLGSKDDLRSGDVVDIYRRGEFVARAVAENIYEDMSSIIILDEWSDIKVLVNDLVRVLRP